MRTLLTTFLTALILICPFVCGEDEVGHGVRHEHSAGQGTDSSPATPCPESGSDNCVCRGAVQNGAFRAIGIQHDAAPLLFLYAPKLACPTSLHHLTWDGLASGLASWGDSLTIRAILQNFRF